MPESSYRVIESVLTKYPENPVWTRQDLYQLSLPDTAFPQPDALITASCVE